MIAGDQRPHLTARHLQIVVRRCEIGFYAVHAAAQRFHIVGAGFGRQLRLHVIDFLGVVVADLRRLPARRRDLTLRDLLPVGDARQCVPQLRIGLFRLRQALAERVDALLQRLALCALRRQCLLEALGVVPGSPANAQSHQGVGPPRQTSRATTSEACQLPSCEFLQNLYCCFPALIKILLFASACLHTYWVGASHRPKRSNPRQMCICLKPSNLKGKRWKIGGRALRGTM